MTGARITTCGVPFASAYGQDPALSGSNDEEALDLGTGIAPLGSSITIDKSANKTEVAVGGEVIYTYEVENAGDVALSNITVTDNKCSPAVYSSGDDGDNLLAPNRGETWIFTCTSNIFVDTINVAFSSGWTGVETINSAPDEWEVTVIPPATIGNYVWLDEDGDGDQDAGEAGIPNVPVTLTGNDEDGNPITLTTYTDANGGYLFDGLPPSDGTGYTITVSPPSGLNQTYDFDATLDDATTVVVLAGDEFMDADFGYNWSTTTETNNNTGTGAIGDRVWIDADGDGVQDPGEAGLGGVEVTLYTDDDGDGIYDDVFAITTTDDAGNYIFDNLPADAYVVEVTTPPTGYTQTGDPDGLSDNKTTSPIILGPGDVYVNADFGYNPTGNSSAIGDYVWLDYDADGVQDVGEVGIPGVTVALILDDGDGVYEPGVDQIIATDITDESGLYLFPGLPAGDYFVWVSDTENVLGELAPTYDGDNDGSLDEISTVTVDGANDNLLQDFGYAPPGQGPGEGVIGDEIWLDDGDGIYEPGEGLEGVRVILTDPGADGILGTADDFTRETFTDENGYYSFGNLEPSLSYQIEVDETTLPDTVSQTVDPDTTIDNTTIIDLDDTGPIDLSADFAYEADTPNTISGTIWEDLDADGTLEGGEAGRFNGVTVVLRDSNGNIVATTSTDGNGDYSFTGLPDGTYTVDVTDENNLLNGYWHSDGPNDNANNNSQDDPYSVSVTGGQTNDTADFGYYIEPAALGNFVWEDLDNDGIQDPGEPGIEGVKVTLTITYPNNDVVTITTTTDVNGEYFFDNLLLDEDYNSSDGGPTYKLSVEVPTNYDLTTANAGATDDDDSDGVLVGVESVVTVGISPNELSILIQGGYNDQYDFGFEYAPTAVELLSFTAKADDEKILLNWETLTESNTSSFILYRSINGGEREEIAEIAAEYPTGGIYSHTDSDVSFGVDYAYYLEDLDLSRDPKHLYGPERAFIGWRMFLPLMTSGW
jgi:hypothetical protein